MRISLRPMLVDVVLAVLLTGLTLATLAAWQPGWNPVLVAPAVLSVAPLALRQVAPVPTMLIIVLAMCVTSLFGNGESPSGGIGLVIAMFSVATLRPRATAALMFAAAVGLMGLSYVVISGGLSWAQVLQSIVVVAGAWAVGDSTRRWSQRSERLAAEAARAVAVERVRIARELHDIVAHHMSVISLQSGLAEFVIDDDPVTAKNAMATVSDAGREANLEMRRLLDVLRVDRDDEADYRPQPGLDQLDDLLNRTRAAGLDLELVVSGDKRPLAPGPDLCAYRMIQESLTNVLKHAGPARARVEIRYAENAVSVEVTDDGSRARTPAPGPNSHGIRGMRERAELYGGELDAGPADDGAGFAVRLRVPA